jgi:hypothetical protein
MTVSRLHTAGNRSLAFFSVVVSECVCVHVCVRGGEGGGGWGAGGGGGAESVFLMVVFDQQDSYRHTNGRDRELHVLLQQVHRLSMRHLVEGAAFNRGTVYNMPFKLGDKLVELLSSDFFTSKFGHGTLHVWIATICISLSLRREHAETKKRATTTEQVPCCFVYVWRLS